MYKVEKDLKYQEELKKAKEKTLPIVEELYARNLKSKIISANSENSKLSHSLKNMQSKVRESSAILADTSLYKGKDYFIYPDDENVRDTQKNQLKILKEFVALSKIKSEEKRIYESSKEPTQDLDLDIRKIQIDVVESAFKRALPEEDIIISRDNKKIEKQNGILNNITEIFGLLTISAGVVFVITFLVSFFGGILLNWKGGISPIWSIICWSSLGVGVIALIVTLYSMDKSSKNSDILKSRIEVDRKEFKNDLKNDFIDNFSDIFERAESDFRDQWENTLEEINEKKTNIEELYNSDVDRMYDFISKNIPDTLINDFDALNDCIYALESGMAINYREAIMHANSEKNERARKEVLDRMDARARRAYLEQQEMQEQQLRYQEQQLRYAKQQADSAREQAEHAREQAESARRQEQYAKEQKENTEKAQQDIERIRRGDFNPY